MMRDRKASSVNPSCIPNNVGVSGFKAQDLRDDESGIHASHNGQLAGGRKRQVSERKVPRVFLIGLQNLISGTHALTSFVFLSVSSSALLFSHPERAPAKDKKPLTRRPS